MTLQGGSLGGGAFDLRPERRGGGAWEDVGKIPGKWNSKGHGAGAGRICFVQALEKRERVWKEG